MSELCVLIKENPLCGFQNQTRIPGSKDKQLRWTRRMQTFNLPSLWPSSVYSTQHEGVTCEWAIWIGPSSRRTWVTGRASHCVIYLDKSCYKEDKWEILLRAGSRRPRVRITEPAAPKAQWRGTGRRAFLHLWEVTWAVTGMADIFFLTWSSLS